MALVDSKGIDVVPFGIEYRKSIYCFEQFLLENMHQMKGVFKYPLYGSRFEHNPTDGPKERRLSSDIHEIAIDGNCLFSSLLYILRIKDTDEMRKALRYTLINHGLELNHTFAYNELNRERSTRYAPVYRTKHVDKSFLDSKEYVPASVIQSFTDLARRHVILFEIHSNGIMNAHLFLNRNVPLKEVDFLLLHASHFTTLRLNKRSRGHHQPFIEKIKRLRSDLGGTIEDLYQPEFIELFQDRNYTQIFAHSCEELMDLFKEGVSNATSEENQYNEAVALSLLNQARTTNRERLRLASNVQSVSNGTRSKNMSILAQFDPYSPISKKPETLLNASIIRPSDTSGRAEPGLNNSKKSKKSNHKNVSYGNDLISFNETPENAMKYKRRQNNTASLVNVKEAPKHQEKTKLKAVTTNSSKRTKKGNASKSNASKSNASKSNASKSNASNSNTSNSNTINNSNDNPLLERNYLTKNVQTGTRKKTFRLGSVPKHVKRFFGFNKK